MMKPNVKVFIGCLSFLSSSLLIMTLTQTRCFFHIYYCNIYQKQTLGPLQSKPPQITLDSSLDLSFAVLREFATQ